MGQVRSLLFRSRIGTAAESYRLLVLALSCLFYGPACTTTDEQAVVETSIVDCSSHTATITIPTPEEAPEAIALLWYEHWSLPTEPPPVHFTPGEYFELSDGSRATGVRCLNPSGESVWVATVGRRLSETSLAHELVHAHFNNGLHDSTFRERMNAANAALRDSGF